MNKKKLKIIYNYFKNNKIKIGRLIEGKVIKIIKNIVYLDLGLKSETKISINEFKNKQGNIQKIKLFDLINVILIELDDGMGKTICSRTLAIEYETLFEIKEAYINKTSVLGIIEQQVKGGFVILINNIIKAFLPGSLITFSLNNEDNNILGNFLKLKVITFEPEICNIILSRKDILTDNKYFFEENKFIEKKSLELGMIVNGLIKNITDYGAFIDLGKKDGLLHITDISWSKIKHPSEKLKIGQKIKVKIINIDRKINRISLGLKQLTKDPWIDVEKNYYLGHTYWGKIIIYNSYGCFVELKKGVQGLINKYDINYINNYQISLNLKKNYSIKVRILTIEKSTRKILLGLKMIHPFKILHENYNLKIGDRIKAIIINITEFGIYLNLINTLNVNVDILVHIADISWDIDIYNIDIKNIKDIYKINDEISIYIKEIDYYLDRIMGTLIYDVLDPIQVFFNKINNCMYVTLKNQQEQLDLQLIYKNIYSINELLLNFPSRINGILLDIPDKNNFYQKNINKILKIKIISINKMKRQVMCKLY